jgi:hypothetical protein
MGREISKAFGYCAGGISAFLLRVQLSGDIQGHLSGRWAQIFPHIYPNLVTTSLWSHLQYDCAPICRTCDYICASYSCHLLYSLASRLSRTFPHVISQHPSTLQLPLPLPSCSCCAFITFSLMTSSTTRTFCALPCTTTSRSFKLSPRSLTLRS